MTGGNLVLGTRDDAGSAAGGKLGVGRSSPVASDAISGGGVGVMVGTGIVCGVLITCVCEWGPGLIGRTASKFCQSGVRASTGDSVSIDAFASGLGTGVSPYEGTAGALASGEGELLRCDLLGVGVGVG